MSIYCELSAEQQTAKRLAIAALRRGQDFWISGQAGSGKSTLLRSIYSELENCLILAPTGKAASLHSERGLEARTLHSFLFNFIREVKNKDGKTELEFRDKRRTEHAGFLIIDESSMLDAEMYAKLRSKRIPTLYVGDHYQLPPVADEDNRIDKLANADFRLSQVHRQAENSPIITLAHRILDGGKLTPEIDGIRYIKDRPSDLLTAIMRKDVDQVIVWKNVDRVLLNKMVREKVFKRKRDTVAQGDRVVCLRNNPYLDIFNGDQFIVMESLHRGGDVHLTLEREDSDRIVEVRAPMSQFGQPEMLQHRADAPVFDYAYAVTAHKAQGSQWESVAVWAKQIPSKSKGKREWLYTAITRAQRHLTIVL